MQEPIITASARSHGLDDADILHAYRNEGYSEIASDEDLLMLVGPDMAGNLLEIGVAEAREPGYEEAIVHAMRARTYYINRYYARNR